MPEGWCWVRVRDIAMVKGGKRLPKGASFSEEITTHAYIRVTDMKNHSVNISNLRYISDEIFSAIKNYTIAKDDLYVTIAGTIGVVGEIPDKLDGMNLTENAVKITNIAINKSFLCIILQTDFVQQQFQNKTHQVAMPKLALERILSTFIPICPYVQQLQIVDRFQICDNFLSTIDTEKEELQKIVSLSKYKILDLAIRGKLVPQDPNDEPASVILERIRTEKEELIKQGKIKRDKKESVIFKGDDNSYYEKVGNNVNCIDEKISFELPEGWAFIRLNTAWELISGRDLSPSEYNNKNDGIPYITGASNFKNGHISLVRWTPVPQVITRRGDLLLTCKGTIGEIAHNNFGEAHIARQIMAIRNIYSLNVDFLALCIEYSMTKIKQAAKGLIPGISREDILNLVIPIPPTKEQENICNKLKATFSAIEHIEKSLN
ncbi:restriction endonuclease subunit S [Roseburia amylophila]|uniref:restriction endonuclease subunit S n=1 Tax=Roseburia amylophila TaxID=2981794 RepID=UPI0032BF7271